MPRTSEQGKPKWINKIIRPNPLTNCKDIITRAPDLNRGAEH